MDRRGKRLTLITEGCGVWVDSGFHVPCSPWARSQGPRRWARAGAGAGPAAGRAPPTGGLRNGVWPPARSEAQTGSGGSRPPRWSGSRDCAAAVLVVREFAHGVQSVLALPVFVDQRRLGKQREFFGVVEREPQTICSVPDTQVPAQGFVDVLGMDPRPRRVVPL